MKMKNKREEQTLKRKKHREKIRNAKRRKRAKSPNLKRSVPTKIEKEKILIVCEGENTEPSYFNKFKLTSATIKSVGEGHNTISLVNRAIKLASEDKYDQVWCVFDKDDFPDENFNNAISIAESQDFQVAYSNQAFEYWFILHFEDHQGGAMDRRGYCDKLNQYLSKLGVTYDCQNKYIYDDFFEILISKHGHRNRTRQSIAIERAKRVLAFHNGTSPAKAESSTTVFRLVEEIEKYK